jgi:carbon monoxide dehydrogenase subunit G
MKKVLKAIVWIFTAFVIVVVGGAYLLPGEVTVQRQIVVNAPPEKVFALVSDFKRGQEWSPWAALDPAMAIKIEGPDHAVGQKFSWSSNNPNVGKGSNTIIELVPNSRVATDLDLGAMGKARAYFDLKPEGSGTAVTWGFKTNLNGVMDRWFGLMMDRFVGPDYEKGLANIKTLAEKEASN